MICDTTAEILKEDVHHMVSILTGARKRIGCPSCGSDEWYDYHEFYQEHEMWSDGFEPICEPEKQFDHAAMRCNECGYNE